MINRRDLILSSAAATVVTSTVAEASLSISRSQDWDFKSQVNGRTYKVMVATPYCAAPPEGYPVLFVLDGQSYFFSAVEAMRSNGNNCVAVVGIGYPDDRKWVDEVLSKHRPLPAYLAKSDPVSAASSTERVFDMTLPLSAEVIAEENIPGFSNRTVADVGGLDSFLKVIEQEIKPKLSKRIPVDRSNQAIFGHSLGGLAVLQALFTMPKAYRSFVSASPSIWWGRKAVLAGEAGFAAAVTNQSVGPRVLLTVGGLESQPSKDPALVKVAANHRMVDNAVDLANRLRALHGPASYKIEGCIVFENVGHSLSVWPAIAQAVSFAFP